ncbi:MAG: hypothetical protein GC168_11680 [Candidatus Hydrogenedens sp.]|nr:hypothetical protein [Candidatus Hydrogenedens sp.]
MADRPILYLDNAEGWRFEQRGDWAVRVDHRDLLAMRHDWTPSNDGDFAQAWREVDIPANWSSPVYLSFYCSDDYEAKARREDAPQLTAEGYIGHRFKQVFVNEQVVWTEDIADPVVKGEPLTYRVPIEVEPGKRIRLGVIVYDRTASATQLPGDYSQSDDQKPEPEANAHAGKFLSNVYWGDFALSEAGQEPRAPRMPALAKVMAVHEKRWPLPLPGGGKPSAPVSLTLHHTASLPPRGFPLRMGVPFPPGAAEERGEVRLQAKGEHAVYAGKTVTSRWPDGSLRWAMFDTFVKPGTETLDLAFRKDWSNAPSPVKTKIEDDGLAIEASSSAWRIQRGGLLQGLAYKGKPIIDDTLLTLTAGGQRARGYSEQVRIVDEQPQQATYLVEGKFQGQSRALGSFRLYITAYAEAPYLQLWLRLINDTPEPLPVEALELSFALAEPGKTLVPGAETEGALRVAQDTADRRVATLTPPPAPDLPADVPLDQAAPFWISSGGLTAALPRFQQLHPKAAGVSDGAMTLNLAAAAARPVVFTPGEAKSHTVWLSLDEPAPEAFAAAAEHPPVWSNPAYYCASGAFGLAHPADGLPKFGERLEAEYAGKDWRALGFEYGLRDFPDAAYMGQAGAWRNNYYDRMHGAWAAWLLTGNPEWFERAEDVCRLVSDVAIVHADVPGQDWLGAMHGPGENHVAGPWNPTLRTDGLVLFDRLTGTPETAEAWLGVADYIARTGTGLKGSSVRQYAGPFAAIVAAYEETGEPSFLDEGSARIEAFWKEVDARRGAWPDVHGSQVYQGNVPWMIAQLAGPLYRWYLATGDVEAAQLVVGLADAMICENTPWDAPGAMRGYSHNPRFDNTAVYDPLILPVLFAAYELSEDPFYLDAAKAQWNRWANDPSFDSVFNTFWQTPMLAGMLAKYLPEALE